MIRSMYSGVAGLRTHQTRMDTIGNNIANVNTYGYKSGRTTFRDIYYQNVSSAAGPGAGTGGVNPSQVGTGTKVGSVDLMMDNSTLTMTGQGMDVSIDGEGFLQVMDGNGNTYYTRAGMLGFDAAGNLVDMQGNFVLGLNGDPTGRAPASERITVSLPAVAPSASSTDISLNGKPFNIKSSNYTKDGNIALSFASDPTMNDSVRAQAKISSAGIQITFNENIEFKDMNEVNNAINQAITAANGGVPHAAGDFSIEFTGETSENPFLDANGNQQNLNGKDLVVTDYTVKLGSAAFSDGDAILQLGGVAPSGIVGSTFGENFANGEALIKDLTVSYSSASPEKYTFVIETTDGLIYKGEVDETKTGSKGTFNLLRQADAAAVPADIVDANDYIEMKRPSFSKLKEELGDISGAPLVLTGTELSGAATAQKLTASQPSKAMGLSGSAISLQGGTVGGSQTINDMAGLSILQDGTVVGRDSVDREIIVGRIILATFANSAGLSMIGSSNFAQSANSGEARLTEPGENNAGKLVSSALELSNVDLSREFSDMITTQRGYQANSRIITVSDTMLEELINLKR